MISRYEAVEVTKKGERVCLCVSQRAKWSCLHDSSRWSCWQPVHMIQCFSLVVAHVCHPEALLILDQRLAVKMKGSNATLVLSDLLMLDLVVTSLQVGKRKTHK